MRESEDRVEFNVGEGGNVSYDGRGWSNPKNRRCCIFGCPINGLDDNTEIDGNKLVKS